jgi:hypothetical protein
VTRSRENPRSGISPALAGDLAYRLPSHLLNWRRAALPGCCFLLGATIAATLPLGRTAAVNAASSATPAPLAATSPVEDRLGLLESRLRDLATERAQANILRAPQAERFFAAALNLQSAIASSRPWVREYELLVTLAPPGALAPALGEVLASHAARGVPTEADLSERFFALAPQLAARIPREGGYLEWAGTGARGGFAAIGLAAPPPPTATEAALGSIAGQLRRGNLAGAASDAAMLDPRAQPLLAGWLAQVRARLAVEQAIRETLLRALSAGPRPA